MPCDESHYLFSHMLITQENVFNGQINPAASHGQMKVTKSMLEHKARKRERTVKFVQSPYPFNINHKVFRE